MIEDAPRKNSVNFSSNSEESTPQKCPVEVKKLLGESGFEFVAFSFGLNFSLIVLDYVPIWGLGRDS